MTTVLVGAFTDIAEDSGTCVDLDGVAVAVFRTGEAVFALADTCSHAEASLCEGDVFDGEVECPLHGASFDIATGKALTLPATQPVGTYRTEIRDGNVFISNTDNEESR